MSIIQKLKRTQKAEAKPTPVTVTMRLPEDLNERFDKAADKFGKTKAWLMVRMVTQFAEEMEAQDPKPSIKKE